MTDIVFEDEANGNPGTLESNVHDIDTPIEHLVMLTDTAPRTNGPRRVRMNRETWNSLSKDDQGAWDRVSDDGKNKISGYFVKRGQASQSRQSATERTANVHDIIFEDDEKESNGPKIEVSTHQILGTSNDASKSDTPDTSKNASRATIQASSHEINADLLTLATTKTPKSGAPNALGANLHHILSKPSKTPKRTVNTHEALLPRSDFTPEAYVHEVNYEGTTIEVHSTDSEDEFDDIDYTSFYPLATRDPDEDLSESVHMTAESNDESPPKEMMSGRFREVPKPAMKAMDKVVLKKDGSGHEISESPSRQSQDIADRLYEQVQHDTFLSERQVRDLESKIETNYEPSHEDDDSSHYSYEGVLVDDDDDDSIPDLLARPTNLIPNFYTRLVDHGVEDSDEDDDEYDFSDYEDEEIRNAPSDEVAPTDAGNTGSDNVPLDGDNYDSLIDPDNVPPDGDNQDSLPNPGTPDRTSLPSTMQTPANLRLIKSIIAEDYTLETTPTGPGSVTDATLNPEQVSTTDITSAPESDPNLERDSKTDPDPTSSPPQRPKTDTDPGSSPVLNVSSPEPDLLTTEPTEHKTQLDLSVTLTPQPMGLATLVTVPDANREPTRPKTAPDAITESKVIDPNTDSIPKKASDIDPDLIQPNPDEALDTSVAEDLGDTPAKELFSDGDTSAKEENSTGDPPNEDQATATDSSKEVFYSPGGPLFKSSMAENTRRAKAEAAAAAAAATEAPAKVTTVTKTTETKGTNAAKTNARGGPKKPFVAKKTADETTTPLGNQTPTTPDDGFQEVKPKSNRKVRNRRRSRQRGRNKNTAKGDEKTQAHVYSCPYDYSWA